ncbi:MAG: cytochrome c biogenesis heme-transporting ATPase CcmA [Gammaproteobacteria bacterium]|nr:cytochrome c biogenesis heme-transporting ATPase CcmA [Gammaproteobacteria bacterium]
MSSIPTSSLLCVNDLACERDSRCLFSGVNFSIAAGDLWHLKGHNGSGKTTLLRLVAGLHPIDVGTISHPSTHAKIIYLGHKLGLKEQLSADENLAWLVGLESSSTQQERYAALEKVGLKGYEENTIATLSAGQRRRVALARLHLCKADIWLLDEPFTALDQQGVEDEESWLRQHTLSGGAVLMTSHQNLSIQPVKVLDLSHYTPAKTSCSSSAL